MAYGFVYALGHEHMPGVFKIGMTDRSPLQRCDELSSGTAVPSPFDLLFYIEIDSAKSVERHMHAEFEGWRISDNREFFKAPILVIFEQFLGYKDEHGAPLALTNKGDEVLSFAKYEESRKEGVASDRQDRAEPFACDQQI